MAIGQLQLQREEELKLNEGEYEAEVYSCVEQERRVWEPLNSKWLELWHLYKTKPLKVASEGKWHSKLNDGRVFEVIETVGSYVRNALFYSDQWLSLEAREPGLAEIAPLASAYFIDCVNNSNFRREFRLYLTQLLLLGNSAMVI